MATSEKRVNEWSKEEVLLWLQNESLGEYEIEFSFNRIDGQILSEMDEYDLFLLAVDENDYPPFLTLIEAAIEKTPLPRCDKSEKKKRKMIKPKELRRKSFEKRKRPADPRDWELCHVLGWVEENNLHWVRDWFIRHLVDGDSLLELTEEDIFSFSTTAHQYLTLAHKISDLKYDLGAIEVEMKDNKNSFFVHLSAFETLSTLDEKVGFDYHVVYEVSGGKEVKVRDDEGVKDLIVYCHQVEDSRIRLELKSGGMSR